MALQPDIVWRLLVGLDEICDRLADFEKVRVLFRVLTSNLPSYRSRDVSFGTDTAPQKRGFPSFLLPRTIF